MLYHPVHPSYLDGPYPKVIGFVLVQVDDLYGVRQGIPHLLGGKVLVGRILNLIPGGALHLFPFDKNSAVLRIFSFCDVGFRRRCKVGLI